MGTARKQLHKIFRCLLPLLPLVVCGVLVFYLSLPALLKATLLPVALRESGLTAIDFDIRSLGLTRTEIGPVHIGRDNPGAIEIDSILITYTPATLRRKRVTAVIIDGLTVRGAVHNGRIELPGLDLTRFAGEKGDPPAPEEGETSAVTLEREGQPAPGDGEVAEVTLEREGQPVPGDGEVTEVTLEREGQPVPGDGEVAEVTLEREGQPVPGDGEVVEVTLPDLPLDRFVLRNGRAELTLEGIPLSIPFGLRLKPSRQGSRIEAILEGAPRQQRLTVSLLADTRDNAVRVMLAADALRLERFDDLLPAGAPLYLGGTAGLDSTTLFSLSPPTLISSRTRIEWQDAAAVFFSGERNLRLSAPEPGQAVVLELLAEEGGTLWRLKGPSVAAATSPFSARLADLELIARVQGQGDVDIAGTARLAIDTVPAGDSGLPFSLKEPLVLPLSLEAKSSEAGTWQAGVASLDPDGEAGSGNLSAAADSLAARAGPPRLTATVKGEDGRIDGRWKVALAAMHAVAPAVEMHIPEIVASGMVSVAPNQKGTAVNAELDARFRGVRVRSGRRTLRLPSTLISGRFHQVGTSPPQAEVELSMGGGTFDDPDTGLAVRGIGGRFPWQAGIAGRAPRSGRFTIGGIRHGDRELGTVTVATRQHGDSLRFSGKHTSGLLQGLTATFSGSLSPKKDDNGGPSAAVAFQIPPYTPETPLALGAYSAALEGATTTGTVSAGGTAGFANGTVSAAAEFELQDGTLEWPDRKLTVKGIQTTVSMAELPTLRTLPGQRLQFESAAIGTLRIDGGSIDFQLESADSFLIERGVVAWCGGRMGAQALRIVPGVSTYDTTLYCDRLNLTRLLEQLGGVRGEGSGTVNGRIPLLIKEGRFTFHDGFLYSTPGEGGRIRVTGTDGMGAGIPVDLARTGYLDLAREALKDYEYRWVKLHLESEKDDLLMVLKFDGKPAGTLPFVYKEDVGGFARVDAGHPGSNFQGLSLDVNLRLPLDKILQYGDITDMLHLE